MGAGNDTQFRRKCNPAPVATVGTRLSMFFREPAARGGAASAMEKPRIAAGLFN
jgi:hypothetical protein